MYVRMVRDHEYVADKDAGIRRRIPLGWVGSLDDAIASDAIEKGNAVDLTVSSEAQPAEPVKSAAEVLAMAETVHFQTFRSEAVKLLGDGAPSTKADLVAALQALTVE